MALTKKDLQELTGLIDKAIKKAVGVGKRAGRNHYKETEKRLFRYPELKKNIEEYKADIEDIRREDFGKSKDIVRFSINSGNTPQEELEEKRQKLIANLENKIASDCFEIRQIDRALERVKGHPYYPIIPAIYFDKGEVADAMTAAHCSERSVFRYRTMLVNQICAALYGADDVLPS